MLNGIDISHHNFNMQNRQSLNDFDFVIMKATEGIRFRDPKMQVYMNVLNDQMLYGFYHFARPDLGNDPGDEATHFVNTIGRYLTDRCLLALDVEAGALSVPNLDVWCAVWAQCVDVMTGRMPLVYISTSETKKLPATAALGCGLWAAKWGKKPTQKQCEPWPFWAIWQYTSDGIFSGVRCDLDYFNGTREQYLKYCKGGD